MNPGLASALGATRIPALIFRPMSLGFRLHIAFRPPSAVTCPSIIKRLRWWLLLSALLGAGGLGFVLGQRQARSNLATWSYDGRGPFRAVDAELGAWGRIRYYPIVLQFPRNRIELDTIPPDDKWFIAEPESTNLPQFLARFSWPEEAVRALVATARTEAGAGCWLSPSQELVRSLTPDLRARFYQALAAWPQNASQHQPVVFSDNYPVRELAQRRLPPATAELLASLLFTSCDQQTFADVQTLFSAIDDRETALTAMQILTGEVSLVPHLILEAHDDVQKLVDYWGVGGRAEQVRSLVEATQLSKGFTTIPLTILLPPFPRTRLFRYRVDEDGPTPDCLYTALNFFQPTPDVRFQDPQEAAREIRENYREVAETKLACGDLILVQTLNGRTIHVCNYLCDDLVFTKNGTALTRPWVVQHLSDVLRAYSCREPITVSYARRNDIP